MAFSLFFCYMFKAKKHALGQDLKAAGSEISPVIPKNPPINNLSREGLKVLGTPARSCTTLYKCFCIVATHKHNRGSKGRVSWFGGGFGGGGNGWSCSGVTR